MKYIRTKYGIYKTDSPIQPEKELQIKWIDDHCFETSWKTKLCDCKQADTIEELCDCKVYRLNGTIKWIVKELADLGQCFEIIDFENWYGALDTDKGLIYVAKMNEKGELELL